MHNWFTVQGRSERSAETMIMAVPSDEAAQSFFDPGLRLKSEVAAGLRDVGKAFRHVARLHGEQPHPRLAAEQRFQHRDEVGKALRAMIAEIVDAVPASIDVR